MKKILWNLGEKKACQKSDIVLAIIKENIDAFYKNIFLKYRSLSIRVEFPNEVLSFLQFPPYMKFDFKALKFIYSYINNRKQRVRIN